MVKRCAALFAQLRNEAAYDQLFDQIIHRDFGVAAVPDALFHYTSIDALGGIAKSRSIWAFSFEDMDDQGELRSLEDVIDDVVTDLSAATTGPAAKLLAYFRTTYPARRAADVLRTTALRCFTAEWDSLPHWEKFTRASGQGVCISFRTIHGEDMPDRFSDHYGLSVLRVEYDPAIWRGRLREGFKRLLDEYNDFALSGRSVSPTRIWHRTIVGMAEIAALASVASKRPKYEDEKEWRHVIVPHPDEPVAWQLNGARRYLPLPARADGKLLLIDRVLVRNANPQAAAQEVERLLREAGYGKSGAPMPEIAFSAYPAG